MALGIRTGHYHSSAAVTGAMPMRAFLAALVLTAFVALPQIAAAQSPSPPSPKRAPSATATQAAPKSTPKVGDWVLPASGGQAMQIRAVSGDEAICNWRDATGAQHHAQFPLVDLSVVDAPSDQLPAMNEPQPYRPCPASVITEQGKHECLD
jgi:uncharacterized protein YodC (DUF2158 family)